MTTIRLTFKRAGIVCALLNVVIGLTACARPPLAFGGAEASSNNAVAQSYPAPERTFTSAPRPTLPGGTPNVAVILAPDEKVAVLNISQLPPKAKPQFQYSVETQPVGGDTLKPALYVVDSQTGNKIQLGEDGGVARFGAMNDRYVIWFFLCKPCPNTGHGLYAYNLNTGENVLITTEFVYAINAVNISDWIVTYVGSMSRYGYTSIHTLYAYDLATGDRVMITDDMVSPGSNGPVYSPINENKIAWLSADPAKFGLSLKIYDFATQTTSEPIQPRPLSVLSDLSVSRNLVVWREGGTWWGYDLNRDALFTVPVMPPGWIPDSVQKVGPVLAKGNQVLWELEASGTIYTFIGNVSETRLGSTPQPTSSLLPPTAPSQPTSYP